MSRHRQWRAWQFARRHSRQGTQRNKFYADKPVKLNAVGRWFKRMGWKGELLEGLIILAVVLILYYTGTIFVFLMICAFVWFVVALLS